MNNVVMPAIKFRMDINAPGEVQNKLLELYNRKLGRLMQIAYQSPLNAHDYQDLPAIRDILKKSNSIESYANQIFAELPESRTRILLDAAPIFNFCPIPMQAYILLALGIRSQHLGPVHD